MIKVAAALNSFASEPEATAPPSEEIFVLSAGQLSDLVAQAIERATAPLESRIEDLERRVGAGEGGEERIRALPGGQETQIATFQVVQDLHAENVALKRELCDLQEITARERAYDRQRISKLERVDPQPLQKDRGEILRALIAANGGKMLATDARKKMHLTKPLFSMLLASMGDDVDIKPLHSDKRKRVLTLK